MENSTKNTITQDLTFNASEYFSYERFVAPSIKMLDHPNVPDFIKKSKEGLRKARMEEAAFYINVWYRLSVQERLEQHIAIYYNDAFHDYHHSSCKYTREYSHYPKLKQMRALVRDHQFLEAIAYAWQFQDDETFPIRMDGGRWEDFQL